MAVLIPKEAIASRWRGACQARLHQAPLEAFLRSRGGLFLPGGGAAVSKNLAAAVMVLARAGLASYGKHRSDAMSDAQQRVLAHATCAMSHALAAVVRRPDAWRIAALLSTSGSLSVVNPAGRAAHRAAAAVQEFARSIEGHATEERVFGPAAVRAVRLNDTARLDALSALIARRLFCAHETQSEQAAAVI